MAPTQGGGGWTQMYSNAYFFCSKCVEMVPPPRAIQSFFCVQNVIDILWNVLYIATTLRPPPSGYPAAGFFWIVFILGVLELICMLAGMFISFAARSELNILLQSGKGSSPVGKPNFPYSSTLLDSGSQLVSSASSGFSPFTSSLL